MIAKPKFIVGLGASAGGLEALEQFFDHLPQDSDCAFVVVMHLSRDFKSMLDELLARHTGMQVKAARHGIEIEANTVYVIQPKTTIEVDGTKLNVSTRPDVDPTGAATSIDTLFKSIARHWQDKGGAVVLSGSGSDGAKGILEVRGADGFTCAQSPETAKFDSMPVAAIATGCVNAVEAPEQLGQTVIDGLLLPSISKNSNILSDHDAAMKQIVDAVVGASDLDARQYKHSTFERRVQRRMMDLRIKTLDTYAARVAEDEAEAEALSQALLIGVTDFFRDEAPYEVIREQIVPEIIKVAYEEERSIRIWSPGCATGQEAYSLAMLFAEALMDMPFKIEVQIFATDISKKHLQEAGKGEYDEEQMRSVPKHLRDKYFIKSDLDRRWTVVPGLRKMIVFAPHDLLSDPPFTKLDMVSCRNILIYFSVEAQQRILGGFGFGLRERGFLFLGSSETVGGQREAFEFIDARNRIFRRTSSRSNNSALAKTRELYPISRTLAARPRRTLKSREIELQPAYAAMLEDYAPASLLVSVDRELLHSFGEAPQFLRTPTGLANLDITDMVDPAMRTPMIAALERASNDRKPITFSRIELEETPKAGMVIDLTIKPLIDKDDDRPPHLLVIIDGSKYEETKEGEAIPAYNSDALVQSRIKELELDLDRTREALQSTIEEIETANEELQASNEQLMSANEELQSTNEELSSVNEELYSVNAEYHRQNDDLSRLTNDFDLLLNATNIGVLFLDNRGRITRYTGLTGELFNLTDSDIGRPLTNFRSPFPDMNPEQVRLNTEDDSAVHETEALRDDGSAWLIRSVSDQLNFGSVLAFIDISALRNAEEDVRNTRVMLESIQRTTKAFYIELNAEFETVINQIGFDGYIGKDEFALPHRLSYDHIHPDDHELMAQGRAKVMAEGGGKLIFRIWNAQVDEFRYVRAVVKQSEAGKWRLAAYDVDEIFRSQNLARKQQAILDATLSVSQSFKAFIDNDERYQYANQLYREQFGLAEEDVVGRCIKDVLPPDLYARVKDRIASVKAGGETEFTVESVINGKLSLLSVHYKPVYDGEDEIIGFVVDGIDISRIIDYGKKMEMTDRFISVATRESSLAILIVDLATGLIEFANSTAMQRIGMRQENFAPNEMKISRITAEWSDERWQDYFAAVAQNDKKLENDVIIFDGATKTTRADIFTEIIQTSDTQRKAIIRVFENIEKVKLLDDLRSRSQQLAISNREMEQFTSAVAHDLRAPLRHISQFAEMLESGHDDMNAAELEENVQIISKSSKALSNMVTGLLDYARMGRVHPEMGTCDLQGAAQSAVQLLSSEISEANAQVEISNLPNIRGNLDLLTQLFQNLISNAIKYKKPKESPQILIDFNESGDLVEVSIADNGIGIDPEYSERIFELFRRLHGEKEYSGLGLGLATCRRIAELHHAQLQLDTEYSAGSRFVLTNLVQNVPKSA